MSLRVDLEIAFSNLAFRRICTRYLPKMCTYASEQLLDAEWLRNVVIGSFIESRHLHRVLFSHGEDDDRGICKLSDSSSQLKAIHLRHGEICDDEVGVRLLEAIYCLQTIASEHY